MDYLNLSLQMMVFDDVWRPNNSNDSKEVKKKDLDQSISIVDVRSETHEIMCITYTPHRSLMWQVVLMSRKYLILIFLILRPLMTTFPGFADILDNCRIFIFTIKKPWSENKQAHDISAFMQNYSAAFILKVFFGIYGNTKVLSGSVWVL